MSWNYRIVRHRTRGQTYYGLHEVYYTKRGKINLWGHKPEVIGDSVKEIIGALAMMIRDATKDAPVLNKHEMPGEGKASKGNSKKSEGRWPSG